MSWEFKCFLTVHDEDKSEALASAAQIVDELSGGGEFSFALDDGDPVEVDG